MYSRTCHTKYDIEYIVEQDQKPKSQKAAAIVPILGPHAARDPIGPAAEPNDGKWHRFRISAVFIYILFHGIVTQMLVNLNMLKNVL